MMTYRMIVTNTPLGICKPEESVILSGVTIPEAETIVDIICRRLPENRDMPEIVLLPEYDAGGE